jgi:hypothetical protein
VHDLVAALLQQSSSDADRPLHFTHIHFGLQVRSGSRAARRTTFPSQELWLVLRAVRDFIAGFRTLHFVGPCVTVFGSARYTESHPYYALARQVGARIVDLGFTVMTGGGPG